MKVTKRNGNMVIYDDQKNIKSILKANAEVACETISEKEAAAIVGQIFSTLAETSTIVTAQHRNYRRHPMKTGCRPNYFQNQMMRLPISCV